MFVWLLVQLGAFGCISDCKYHFTDRNGWPISPDQENDLYVLDALQNKCVKIAWPSDVSTSTPAVVQKTWLTAVKLKRSISVEQGAAKHPRWVF